MVGHREFITLAMRRPRDGEMRRSGSRSTERES